MQKKHVLLSIAGLLLALGLTSTVCAQSAVHYDAAAVLNYEHGQVAVPSGNRFWLRGGALDGSVTFYKGWGLAANFTGEHTGKVTPGIGLTKFSWMGGPRYTANTSHAFRHDSHLFGEALFGIVRGSDSVFPSSAGAVTKASGTGMQFGGGLDIGLTRGVNARAIEMDYVHSNLPNNASNAQNGLRLAFGISYRH